MHAEIKRRIFVVVLGLTIVLTGCDFGGETENVLPIEAVESLPIEGLLGKTSVVQALNIPACVLEEGGCDKPADTPVLAKPAIINPNVENAGDLCPTLGVDNGGANDSLLAYANAAELTLVYAHGDVVHVALPNFEAATGSKIWTKVQATGNYILVKRDWRKPGFKHIRGVVYTMLDRDGNLVWHVHQKGVSGDAQVLDNASVVGQTTYYPLQGDHYRRTMTIDPSGAVNEFDEDYKFLGAAVRVEGDNPHYEMPVRLGDDQDRQVGWLNLDDGTFNPFWFGDDTNDVKLFGNHLYRFTLSCGYFLAVSTAGGDFDFQGLEFYFDIYQSRIVASTSTGWVLFQHNETNEYTRLRLHSDGETLAVVSAPQVLNLTPPAGFETTCQVQPELDDRGGVLFTFRDEFKALVFRQDRHSDQWEAIGAPMANIIPVEVEANASSIVVNSSLTFCQANCGGAFEETLNGTSPIDGPSVQVIHPRSGNTFILNKVGIGSDPTNFLPKFDKTGQCFSTSKWSQGSFYVEVVDVVLGTTTKVDFPGMDSVPTWLP